MKILRVEAVKRMKETKQKGARERTYLLDAKARLGMNQNTHAARQSQSE